VNSIFFVFHFSIRVNCNRISEGLLYVSRIITIIVATVSIMTSVVRPYAIAAVDTA
jgi:hypothetical protein